MRIALTADHNGIELARRLAPWLAARGHEVDDRVPSLRDGDVVDYPPLCEAVCRQVLDGAADYAVVIGGGGSGETIACNKLAGIRAVSCPSVWQGEIARGNNDANVLVLGAKVVEPTLAERILDAWLSTPFKGAEHARRLEMVSRLERGESLLEK